jgi:tetratricopeptide (TPR) repeat protein
LLLLAIALALPGCRTESPTTSPAAAAPPTTAAASQGADELSLAVDSLRKLAEGASAESMKRTYFYFNQWLASYEPAKAAWQPDKALEHLPLALRQTPGLDRLNRPRFEKENLAPIQAALRLADLAPMQQGLWLNDMAYFQQTLWLHDIAERVRRQSPPPELKSWLKQLEQSAGLPEAEQLTAAERLFDWTIRNLQLDPLPPMPKPPVATVDPTTNERRDPVSPAQSGELGPGYGHLPVQILLYGHGDAHERARIFIQLCRQAGIDAVMLGLIDDASPIPRPWVPAALIGGQLYLFDTALGVPIPGLEGKGIATLDQVAKQPDLLKALDVEGQPPYPVGEKDLKAVIALIDAEPAALSKRMQHLQAAMPRRARLVLSVQPSQLEARLREKNKSLSTVALWRAPFEAILYQVGRLPLLARDPAAAEEFDRVQNIFSPGRPLLPARNLHLQGKFADGEKEVGARTLYIQCRRPDREIDALQNSSFFRAAVGLQDNPKAKPEERKAMLERITTMVRTEKQHATYWLGLSYYEEGNFSTTLEFLGQRTIGVSPPSPWDAGARYNLARCYEDLGQLDLARQWLESDKDSPQRTGNLLRARWLKARQ